MACLTLILLTWRIWWVPNNASRWQMGFNSAFKGLKQPIRDLHRALRKFRFVLIRSWFRISAHTPPTLFYATSLRPFTQIPQYLGVTSHEVTITSFYTTSILLLLLLLLFVNHLVTVQYVAYSSSYWEHRRTRRTPLVLTPYHSNTVQSPTIYWCNNRSNIIVQSATRSLGYCNTKGFATDEFEGVKKWDLRKSTSNMDPIPPGSHPVGS